MADHHTTTTARTESSVLQTNKVLRNTYALLSMTLAFSALTAAASMAFEIPRPHFLIVLVAFYGLLFGIEKTKNSATGLILTFVLTGFMGMILGPILNFYLSLPNGGQLVATAMGMTAFVFLGLSGYVLTTRKDMSFLSGFIVAGMIVLVLAMLVGFFFQIPGLQIAISAGFVLFSSAVILYQTSEIIHGGEDNYISATVSLYVSIYNLFLSLLQILGFVSSDD